MRQLVLDDLYLFCKFVLNYNRMIPALHMPLCRFLQRPGRRKLILMPRWYFKTTICTVGATLHSICRNPNLRILPVFNTEDNSMARVGEIKAHVETNPMFHLLFPDIVPDMAKPWSTKRLTFKHSRIFPEANVEAAGVNTDLTSRHYNRIGEDDPIAAKRDQLTAEEIMPSPEDIDKGIGFHKMLVNLRIPDEPGFPFERWYIGTRWCANDVVQWILDHEPDYEIFLRRAENEAGESAYPEMISTEELHRIRDVELGPYMYSSQMLLEPVTGALQAFHPDAFEQVWTEEAPIREQYIFVDPSHTGVGKGSCTCVMPIDVTPTGHINIRPHPHERMEPAKVVATTVAMAELLGTKPHGGWEPPIVYVEDVAGQKAFKPYIYEMQSPGKPFEVRDIHPLARQRKDERIRGLTNWAHARRFRLPTFEVDLEVRGFGTVRCHRDVVARQAKQFPFNQTEKDALDALSYAPRVIGFPSEPEESEVRSKHSASVLLDEILQRHEDRMPLPMTRIWREREINRDLYAYAREG